MTRRLSVPLGALLAAALCSCGAKINGELRAGGAGELRIEASFGKGIYGLARSFAAFSGDSAGAAVLDAERINRSLRARPGVSSSSLVNSSPQTLAGTVTISALAELLNANQAAGVTFTEKNTGKAAPSGALKVTLDRASAPQLLSLFAEELSDYLAMLLAPIATGEALSRQEYLETLRSIYSGAVADEIAAARVTVSLRFPSAVKAVSGGAASGRSASFDIPLLDILVLDKPCVFEVEW
ncbi:MAG: hypothetical protein LBR16_01500 [Treponema sp.]|jgi:hypothetical protein|nr:hypothetical protein [Treponema sp.]